MHTLMTTMLPILGTQLANMVMGFVDASMSGQAGNVDLAGSAIGSNIWDPVYTCFIGILMGATPLMANALGAGKERKIRTILMQGLLLAVIFGVFVIVCGYFCLPIFLAQMELEPEVYDIAFGYLGGVALGVIPFFMTVLLRCLIDTLGRTDLTMKLYLVGLPVNAILNYLLIFGKCGLPRLGGIGAGVATGLTYWLLFIFFSIVVLREDEFRRYMPFSKNPVRTVSKTASEEMMESDLQTEACSFRDYAQIKEYLRIGIPMGFSIFLEVGVFSVVAFFIAKFGTDIIAAHQAAMNMACLVYMIPLSFAMALTIIIGIEYGAERLDEAKIYGTIGIQLSVAMAFVYLTLEFFGRGIISYVYSSDANVRLALQHFIIYAIVWQCGDAIAAPIQGILRGYKDVDATFWASVLAYWGICLPVGLLMDLHFNMGPFAYWQSLALGVICSAAILVWRLCYIQKNCTEK